MGLSFQVHVGAWWWNEIELEPEPNHLFKPFFGKASSLGFLDSLGSRLGRFL